MRTLFLMAALALAAAAQHSNGYVFVAPGGATCCGHTASTLHFGFGGEGILGKGVGIGAELGGLGPTQNFTNNVLGVFSPNGYYHFIHGGTLKADPFVTGGYTLLFRNGHLNLFNFGGGMNYWFHRRLGARLEFRDHVYTQGATLHYWGFRFGLSFRSSPL